MGVTIYTDILWNIHGKLGGQEVFAEALGEFSAGLSNLAPLWERISRNVLEPNVQHNFDAEGGIGADDFGPWESLKDSTNKKRVREGFTAEHPILQRTQRLRDSFEEGGPDHIEEFLPDSGYWGSETPYAGYHQAGTRNMVARPILFWNAEIAFGFGEEVAKYMDELTEASFG